MIHKGYSKIIKISQNSSTNVTPIDIKTLPKLTHKRYSKLLRISHNSTTSLTQIDAQTLPKIT